jgi:hypothetical protein
MLNIIIICVIFLFYVSPPPPRVALHPNYMSWLSFTGFRDHTQYGFSGRVISPMQRSLPYNTLHSQQTRIHTPGGIWTHNPCQRVATYSHLRPFRHWDRSIIILCNVLIYLHMELTFTVFFSVGYFAIYCIWLSGYPSFLIVSQLAHNKPGGRCGFRVYWGLCSGNACRKAIWKLKCYDALNVEPL